MTENIAIISLVVLTTGVLYIYRKLRSIRCMNTRMQNQLSEYFTGQTGEVSPTASADISSMAHDHFAGEILNDYRLKEMLKAED
jgi:hypothetical protein